MLQFMFNSLFYFFGRIALIYFIVQLGFCVLSGILSVAFALLLFDNDDIDFIPTSDLIAVIVPFFAGLFFTTDFFFSINVFNNWDNALFLVFAIYVFFFKRLNIFKKLTILLLFWFTAMFISFILEVLFAFTTFLIFIFCVSLILILRYWNRVKSGKI